MTSPSRPLSARERWIYGAVAAGIGIFCVWLGLSDPSSVNGPWWLGASAGAVFVAAGLAVFTQGTPMGRWASPAAVAVILLGLAAIGNWIAFGPGPRACTGGISFLFFHGSATAGETECRVAFGFGAVLLDAILVVGGLVGVARLLGSSAWAERLEKIGVGIVGVVVSPLILLAALASAWGAVREKLWGRRGR